MKPHKKKIFKWFLIGIASILGIAVLGILLIYARRDSIAKDLLIRANSRISGLIQVEEVSIDPWVHFPRTSLTLQKFALFKEKVQKRDSLHPPVIELEAVSISLDLLGLLQSRLELTELTATNGHVHVSKGKGGDLNISQALSPPGKRNQKISDPISGPESKPTPPADRSSSKDIKPAQGRVQEGQKVTTSRQDPLELSLDGLHFENIAVVLDGIPNNLQQRFTITESDATFKYVKDSLNVQLEGQFEIEHLSLDRRLQLEEEVLGLSLDFFFDRGDHVLSIHDADIAFRNARLDVEGSMDFKQQGNADLSFKAIDDQMQFTRLFLSSEGIDHLQDGHLHLSGTVEGPFREQLPQITCAFGARDLHMEIPNSDHYLRELNINGYFESGNQMDLSKATLRLDTVHAVLHEGYIRASTTISNLRAPDMVYDLDASLRLDYLAKFLDLGSLDSLSGRVEIRDSYMGKPGGPAGLEKDRSSEPFTVAMEEVSFVLPGIPAIDDMSGRLVGSLDSLRVDSLRIRSGESDITLDGAVSGLSALVFGTDEPIKGDMRLQSGSFDFPRMFKSLPKTAAGFPYTISELNIDFATEIFLSGLDTIQYVPEMHYDIRSATGVIEGLLPPTTLSGGHLSTLEKDGSYLLDFEDFELEIQGYHALAGLAYFGGDHGSKSMVITMQTEGMNPGRIFYQDPDSIPAMLDAEITGRYKGLLQLPTEAGSVFQSVNIGIEEFEYRGKDTLSIEELTFRTNAISYRAQHRDSILKTLTASGDIFLRGVQTPRYRTDSLEVFITAREGEYKFVPRNYLGKGKDDFGTIILEPFRSPPRYQLDYRIKELRLEELLKSFNEENILTGEVDLQLQLTAEGNDKDELTRTAYGSMLLEGEDLKLRGIDLDKVIENFSRSQTFNFMDLGAVLLTGPVGIVYTKGLDYFNLVAQGTGDSSQISKFSSRWSVENGRIAAQDVAFATLKNRMAAKGWLSTQLDSLDMTLAVIDKRGCAIIDQRVYGNSKAPEYSKLKVIETLLAPVTDAVGGFLGVKCEVFYDGVVQHPEGEKK